MENKVSSELSASSALLMNLASTDVYKSDSDSKIILESVIRNLEELCLKISVTPKPESKLPPKCNKTITIEFELRKEYSYYFLLRRSEDSSNLCSRTEQIDDLLHRLQMLQEFYILLLDAVKFTFHNLKSMYDQKLYDIQLTKREAAPLPLQEVTATEQEETATEPEGLDKSTQTKPTEEYPVLQHKTEKEEPSGSKSTQANPSQETKGQEEPSGYKPSQVKPTKEVPTHHDGISSDKKEQPIDEAGASAAVFVHPEPVKERAKLSLKHKEEEKLKATPKKRKLSYLEAKVIKRLNTTEYPIPVDKHSSLVIIGPNATTIEQRDYEGLQLKGGTGATRLLCDLLFGDEILATHSLTGNQSPAFRGRERPLKKQLDPLKIADIQHLVCSKFNISQQLVRATITTKCADSSKKLRRISSKSKSM